MAVFAESEKQETLNSEQIKSLSGNDTISYRPLFGHQSLFTPVCKLIMQTNHKPLFDSGDEAIMDCIKFTPFFARFITNPSGDEKKKDPKLVQELHTVLLDALFTWVLAGCIEWYKTGLGDSPDVVVEATKAYVTEVDDIGRFIEEACVDATEHTIGASELYEGYTKWATSAAERYKSQKDFGGRMKKLYSQKKIDKTIGGKKKKILCYVGIQLEENIAVAPTTIIDPDTVEDFIEDY
jgi:phage/plasmid-associated DNA primase